MSQRLTTARLATLPADVVDLTVEIREEPEEEVVPESPIWDREEELSMDDDEDGSVIAVVVCDYFIARRCYFFLFLSYFFSFSISLSSYFLSHDQGEDIYSRSSSGTLVSTTLVAG